MVNKKMDKIEESMYIARMAEQAERYRDMADAMRHVVGLGGGVSPEQRELLSVAYQNLTGTLRSSRRMLSVHVDDTRKQVPYSPVLWCMHLYT